MASLNIQKKRERVEGDILRKAEPMIESGEYSQLTIRELCDKMDITTGLFYRHYKTKNDLLSFYAIEKNKSLYEIGKDSLKSKSLKEKLLQICLWNIETMSIMGPDSILIYLNNDNPACSCEVSRQLFLNQIQEIFETSFLTSEYQDKLKKIGEYLIIIEKGLCFEWYSRKEEADFDLMKTSELLLSQMIDSFDL